MSSILKIFVLATVLVAGGCAAQAPTGNTPPSSGQPHRIDGAWVLTDVGAIPMHGGIQAPTLLVDGESVSGFAGVNRFSGGLAAEGPFLFGPLATTRMAGPAPAIELETRYLAMLQQATGWRLEDSRLVLVADGGTIATFSRDAGSD